MKVTLGQLRSLIREEVSINELFGKPSSFAGVLDSIVNDLYGVTKKVEKAQKAHELAPGGAAKAIVTGLHSDLFNQVAEFRKYVERLKGMAKNV